jgi:hypothetical protein
MTIVLVILAAAVSMLVSDLLRIDMIALMIMGRGITQTGMMDRFSDTVIRLAGTSRGKKNKEKPCC